MPGVIDLLAGRGVHLGALTAWLAARHGDRPAVEDEAPTPGLHDGGLRTHRDLEDHVARLAAALRARGVAPGDRVLVVVGNRVDVLLHLSAVARLGAVAALASPRLRAAELAAIATAAGARRAVADDVEALAGVTAGDGATADEGPVEAVGTADLADWLAAHPAERVEAPDDLDPRATALLLATSGTTGLPKAAALTSRGLTGAPGALAVLPVGRQRGPRAGRDLVLEALPLTHVFGLGMLVAGLVAGVPVLHLGRFEPDRVLDLLERRRPNVFLGVPTMYADLEEAGADERDLRSVQVWGSGADVMPPDRARRFQRRGAMALVGGRALGQAAFVDGYGMVELSGAAALRVYAPLPVGGGRLPSFAVALPGMRVRAVDPDGQPMRAGRVGELQFRGPGVTRGYEGRDDGGPDAEGWFSTGDHGRVWPGGLFAFAGRTHDRLKVGGFSVFPAEVEQELRTHEQVRDVVVVGLPDERVGHRLTALVVPEPGTDPDLAAWLSWAAEQVAGYRRPRACALVDEVPRGNHGKVDRAEATDLARRLAEDGALTTADA